MKKLISNIVFTKNRPLQLHAYLESLYRFLPHGLIQTYVLYKVELFGQQYEQLFKRFPDCIVIREKNFQSDFLSIINQVDTPYILFGIDDVVYFDSVDFDLVDKTFYENSNDIFGFSFKLDPRRFEDTGDVIADVSIKGQTVHKLNWKTGRTRSSRYCFELCATVYRTELVKKIIQGTMNSSPLLKKLFSPGSFLIRTMGKVVSARSTLKTFGYFYNPNTLESWNCRWCQNHPDNLPSFLFFQNQKAIAIQVNLVNTSTESEIAGSGEHTVETLNEKYKRGCRLDVDFVAGLKPVAKNCGPECFRLTNPS